MDVAFSPMVTVVLNIIAGALVSKGVLDAHSKDAFVILANNVIAGFITVSISLYSIFKVVDLKKHQITTVGPTVKTEVSQTAPGVPVQPPVPSITPVSV